MRVCLFAVVAVCWFNVLLAEEPTNLLRPIADVKSWGFEQTGQAAGSMEATEREIQFNVTRVDGQDWHVQVFQSDLDLTEGERYTVKFKARSHNNRGYSLRAMIHVEDYHEIGLRNELVASKHFREESITFTALGVVAGKNRVGFVLGDETGALIIKDMTLTKEISPPKDSEPSPGPWNDPAELTIWPNQTSRSNSDKWLAVNHDKIRLMRPRVLLINFSNEHNEQQLQTLTDQLIFTLAESSRYHGYMDPKAHVFLEYQIFKFVDLRDAGNTFGNSTKLPVKDPKATSGYNMKYRDYFSESFAQYYQVPDPREPTRFLRLDELLDSGFVHEVWFFESGNTKALPHSGSLEVVEQKPRYDGNFNKIGQEWVQAGNGGDPDQPWVGRSCRIGCINASRGIGCFMESLAHGIEGISNSKAIPYFSKYFTEFADFNLKERYGVPFESLYAIEYKGRSITYPTSSTMVVTHAGVEHTLENYIPAGGSAHFPPNARNHYDLDNPYPVLSTIEDWRIGSAADGKDRAKLFSNEAFRCYRDIAPDCMGPWLVYWRQNMPTLANKQKDDSGQPMKNWLPFLFY